MEINNLYKQYGHKEVLKGISAQFEPGKAYGIVGENGAGKTTLFKCIAGLESYAGDIYSQYRPLKNVLGYLPTDLYFFDKITGKEYIQLLCMARKVEVPDFDRINIFDLPLDVFATTYSTGMQKKLAMTALLLQKNEVYILDEPFNGVDIQSNIVLVEIIKKLKSLGKIVLVSSHIFSTLYDLCDEIFYLQGGQFSQHVGHDQFRLLEEQLKQNIDTSIIERLQM